jgi:hypothetical protein
MVGRLFQNLRDLRRPCFRTEFHHVKIGRRESKTLRIAPTFWLSHALFCHVSLVHCFGVSHDTPPAVSKGEYLFRAFLLLLYWGKLG